MSRYYSDQTRESDPYSLPDLEVFYRSRAENRADGWFDDDGTPLPSGWYYWACLPGCLPDSGAFGPFKTERAALRDAREMFGSDE